MPAFAFFICAAAFLVGFRVRVAITYLYFFIVPPISDSVELYQSRRLEFGIVLMSGGAVGLLLVHSIAFFT